VTSSWSILFNYQDDARSNKHNSLIGICLSRHSLGSEHK